MGGVGAAAAALAWAWGCSRGAIRIKPPCRPPGHHHPLRCLLLLPFCAGDGGVIKTIVKEGTGWAKPLPADEVRRADAATQRAGCWKQHALGLIRGPLFSLKDSQRGGQGAAGEGPRFKTVRSLLPLTLVPGVRALQRACAGRGGALLRLPRAGRGVLPERKPLLPRHRNW